MEGLDSHYYLLLKLRMPGGRGVGSAGGSPISHTKQFIAALRAAGLEPQLFTSCPLLSVLTRALKGSSGDRNPIHDISHVSAQFAFHSTSQFTLIYLREQRMYSFVVITFRSLDSVFFSFFFLPGINSAVSRLFYLANKHCITYFIVHLLTTG